MRKKEVLKEAYSILHSIYSDDFEIDNWTKDRIERLFNNHEFHKVYDSDEETPEIKLFDEVNSNTGIEWWDENRERVNNVIRMVNEWQVAGEFDRHKGKVILATIEMLRREYPEHEDRGLTDWQFEILDEIETFVDNKLE